MPGWISRGTSTGFIVTFLVVIVIVSGAATLLLYGSLSGTDTLSSSSTTSTSTEPEYVTVFGLVATLGEGTHPVSMVFTSVRDGQEYVAAVNDGSFSTKLPNLDTYNVTLRWAGNYTWQTGQIDRGRLSVNMSGGTMDAQSYNVAQMTPCSVIKVEGSISWQIQTSSADSIRFTANDGEVFQAPVSNSTFSIVLPNSMNYEVYVQSRNATGYTDWYYFHQLQVDAGVNVVGLTVRIGY